MKMVALIFLFTILSENPLIQGVNAIPLNNKIGDISGKNNVPDGKIDFNDLSEFAALYSTGKYYDLIDFNRDSNINSEDIIILVDSYNLALAPLTTGGLVNNRYTISRSGNSYFAHNPSGVHITSSTDFPDVWDRLHAQLVTGDTVEFKGSEFIADRTIRLTKNGITIIGLSGATIRAYSSTIAGILFDGKGSDITISGMKISGLGYTDNRDMIGMFGSTNYYQLFRMDDSPNFLMDNCTIEHHHQYLMQISNSADYTIKNSIFRYGQNGFSTYGSGNNGIVENNLINDCSQSAIKLRGDTATIVRYNTIREEYTYWRGFDHLTNRGTDGRGVTGNTQGCQGIYFGVTDPQPCFNVDVYGNTITDASRHGTVQVKDVVDGTWRTGPPNSFGCWFPADAGQPSSGNKFHGNTVDGAYTGVKVANYATRNPSPLNVYDNTFRNIVGNEYSQTETITVNSTIIISSDFDGGGNTYIRGSSLGDVPLMKLTGTGNTLKNCIFDDQNYLGSNTVVALTGTDNIIESCTLNNCQRYGFAFQVATRCTFRALTINKAQHGISGSTGFDGQWNPSVDCVIEDCTIKGMIIDGIKLKNMLRPIVRRNTIDVFPLYPTYLGQTTKYSKSGLYFAGGDSAIKYAIVEDNDIFQSAPTPIGLSNNRAVCCFPDQTAYPDVYSEGNQIINNRFSNVYTGVWFKPGTHGYYATDNVMTGVTVPYDDDGYNTAN